MIVTTGAHIDAIAADGVHITLDGKARVVKADGVVIPPVLQADTSLADALQGAAPVVTAIGDATGFGLLKKAVGDAVAAVHALS